MAELTGIESKLFTARDFRLESGQSLPVLELAYETYGSLSPARDNAVLVVHGYTSSHHAAGRNAPGKQGRGVAPGAAGWFDGLIGPSMGGFQSFQWAASYPGFMKAIVPSVTAPRSPAGLDRLEALQTRLASDPNWNGGWYYDTGGIARTLEELRFETLMAYGQNEILAETMPDPKAREAAIRANAKAWAQIYDGHSMVTLRKAIGTFDITGEYAKLKGTKVLYVQSPSDKLFDIALSPAYVSDMRKAGIDVTYVELPTNKGHMASHADAALWAPILGAFLKRLS